MALAQRCDECGFEFRQLSPPDAVVALRTFARRYREAFAGFDEDDDVDALIRRRPAADVWSALEYAAHMRGVLELYRARIERALYDDGATMPGSRLEDNPWEGHDSSDSAVTVLEGLGEAAAALADTIHRIPADGWERGIVREGESVDVLWMTRQAVHEGSHHLRDVYRVIDDVRRQFG